MRKAGCRQAAAVLMAAALVFGTGGCKQVTKLSLLKEVSEQVSKAESYAMKTGMEMEAQGSVSGISMDMIIDMDMDVEINQNPAIAHGKGTMSVEVLNQTQEIPIETYTLEEDGKAVVYSYTDGEWLKETQENASQGITGALGAREYLAMADSVELEKETEDVEGQECYVLTGSVQGELLESITGSMAEALKESEFLENMDWDAIQVPVKVYITKEKRYPAKISMDLKTVMNETLKAAVPEIEVEFSCENCKVEMEFSSFGEVGTITLPEEVEAGNAV